MAKQREIAIGVQPCQKFPGWFDVSITDATNEHTFRQCDGDDVGLAEGLRDARELFGWNNSQTEQASSFISKRIAEINAPPAPEPPREPTQQIPAYKPFPVDKLPGSVGDYIKAAAKSIGCDLSFIALPLLACLARAIGNTRVIRLKRTWVEPAILWVAIVGKSGTHKTPAIHLATKFLAQRQTEAIENYQEKLEQYEQEKAIYDRDYKAWNRSKSNEPPPWEPEAPICVRYITSDATIEAIAGLLASQVDPLLFLRDELAGWLGGMGEYKGGKGGDLSHWLAAWSTQPMTIDRKTGDKKMIHIPRAGVNLVGGIQPGILRKAIGREHLQDGLCQRLLVAMPETKVVQWTEATVSHDVDQTMGDVFANLFKLEAAADEFGKPEPFKVDMNEHAKSTWIEYYNRHRNEGANLDDDLAAAWSKIEGYTARFALIFQACSWAAGEADFDAIDQQSMEAAIAVSEWFGHEAQRVYATFTETDQAREQRELVELIRRKGGSVTARDLMRSSRRFPDATQAEVALNALAQSGVGSWEVDDHGGGRGAPAHRFNLAT